MKEIYLDGITKTSELEDDMFIEILSLDDAIDRSKYIEDVRRKCKPLGRVTEFNNLLKAWMQKNAQLIKQADSNDTNFTDAPIQLACGRWKADDTGVYTVELTKGGDSYRTVACPHPILPVERLVNIDTDMEKIKLAFFKDSRWREITAECGVVFNKNQISVLSNRGILVTSESSKDLVRYLNDTVALNLDKIPLYRSISRLGWIEGGFAPYVPDIKYDGDLDFQNIYNKVEECGSYDTWLTTVSEARKNICIRLMLSASFGSVLIEKVGALPFVLHLWGTSGTGKTVALMISASVWGNPEIGGLVKTMNMTANAMARTSAFLYNIPFCADELQQIKDRWNNYDQLIMYICEGIDRGRAKASGGIEEMKQWRNAFILTGEEPVTKANSGGGVKNRCIEVEVKGKLVNNGHEVSSDVKTNYGFAGKKFVEYIQGKTSSEISEEYKAIAQEIMASTDTTDKQAYSMAILILADKYSCECIFQDSEPLKVDDVKEYLISEKTMDTSERAYEWVLNWLGINISRFDTGIENKGEVWGKFGVDYALINKNILIQKMAQEGFEFDAVKRKWAESGKLETNSQGRYHINTKVNGIKGIYIKVFINQNDFKASAEFEPVEEQTELPFE